MTNLTDKNFGLLVAYLLPGLIVLVALRDTFPIISTWLGASVSEAPTIGGFLYATVAAVGAGLVVSAIRWLIVDRIHHATGITEPGWDFEQLQSSYEAFTGAVSNHYRYYQAYANTLSALGIAVVKHIETPGYLVSLSIKELVASIAISAILFTASRDSLRKYYDRTNAILKTRNPVQQGESSNDERMASRRSASIARQTIEGVGQTKTYRLLRGRRAGK